MPKFCPNCGNPLNEGVKFCTKCGTPVTVDDSAEQSEAPFKPVFTETEVSQTTHTEDTYHTETAAEPAPYVQPTYAEPAANTVRDYVNVDRQEATGKPKKEKKYFGFKNILLFLLNAGMIALYFLGGLFINIDPMQGFKGLEKGAEISLSFGKGFLYILQSVFGFGSFDTGVSSLDEILTDTSKMILEGTDPAIAEVTGIVRIVGIVGAVFVALAALAALVSLIRIFIRKRGVSGNVLTIFSSLYGLILGGGIVGAVLLFKDRITEALNVAEGYELVPMDFGVDTLGYAFVGVALLAFIIAIVTIKK